ncbi:putative endonuclease [Izhakiella capsodis]|uniref:Putative endonuclease n=1 Tax=Izhakiella capsodis TaxID=1367852 RepID=A0A1I4XHT7_9GAMM|nr:GIY-YIG nuclease family protein [Izhakiella capsodis]SFN25441.1 putative endonuclease [Izhakiella capsodis]
MALVPLLQQQRPHEPPGTGSSLTVPEWQLYILRTAYGVLYTGITTDVARRMSMHQNGKGAKSLRGKGPLELMFQFAAGDRSSASHLEYHVKQLTRLQKLRLISERPPCLNDWLIRIRSD